MARFNKNPIVFAFSNPTSKSESTAEQAYRWSDGRALFACGSPFDPVTLDGRTFVPRQGNNSYIFPGVGLGAIASRMTRITDEMFLVAARTLASQVSEADLAAGSLYPALAQIREVSAQIAAAVAGTAYAQGHASAPEPGRSSGFRQIANVRADLSRLFLDARGAPLPGPARCPRPTHPSYIRSYDAHRAMPPSNSSATMPTTIPGTLPIPSYLQETYW